MAGEAGGGDEVSSPKNRVKFLYSYGGKILPRSADGLLKYVGGETRVIALSRNVTFSELMKKVGALFDGEMVLKYQLVAEDLDALVSVRSDEDLKHMMDEYDRQQTQGSARLRTFLFPSKPILIDTQSPLEAHQLDQRYIDAINGIIRSSSKPPSTGIPTPVIATSPSISMSSACSSPKSASSDHHHHAFVDISTRFSPAFSPPNILMHKVHSSPSICSSFNLQPPYTSPGGGGGGHAPRHHYHYHHGHQPSSRSPHHRAGGPGPPLCPSNNYNSNYSNTSRHPRPSGGEASCSKCGFYDDNRLEKAESITLSRSHRRSCWD